MTKEQAIQKLATSENHEQLFFYDHEIRQALFNGNATLSERIGNARYHALQFMTPEEFYTKELPKLV